MPVSGSHRPLPSGQQGRSCRLEFVKNSGGPGVGGSQHPMQLGPADEIRGVWHRPGRLGPLQMGEVNSQRSSHHGQWTVLASKANVLQRWA